MNILVINSGSSSLKYQLYNMTDESVLAKGLVERIGMDSSILNHKPTGKQEVTEVSEILEHNTAIRKVLACLTDKEHGVIGSTDEINAVGHRVVHGGNSSRLPLLWMQMRRRRSASFSTLRRCIILLR